MQMGRTELTHDRRRVRVPNVCRWCEGVGTVVLEVRIVGGSVALRFVCRTCALGWTATPTEILPPDHRFGPTDRRRGRRVDRRRSPRG